jgi:hypothetical protein
MERRIRTHLFGIPDGKGYQLQGTDVDEMIILKLVTIKYNVDWIQLI